MADARNNIKKTPAQLHKDITDAVEQVADSKIKKELVPTIISLQATVKSKNDELTKIRSSSNETKESFNSSLVAVSAVLAKEPCDLKLAITQFAAAGQHLALIKEDKKKIGTACDEVREIVKNLKSKISEFNDTRDVFVSFKRGILTLVDQQDTAFLDLKREAKICEDKSIHGCEVVGAIIAKKMPAKPKP